MTLDFSVKLKTLMSLLDVSNARLAKAMSVDPSLISRWLSAGCGKRKAAQHSQALGRYFAGQRMNPETASRLRAELGCAPGTPITADVIADWLCPDQGAEEYASMLVVDSFRRSITGTPAPVQERGNFSLCEGGPQIAAALKEKLSGIPVGSRIEIYLSSETLACAVDPDILPVLVEAFESRQLKGRLLVQSANNSAMCGRLVSAYMPLLVQGRLEFSVIQGTPQTFTANMTVIVPDCFSIVITEAVKKHAAAVATVLPVGELTADMLVNFQESMRFARPMVTLYDDNFARNIIENFFEEYGVPGSLDVIKSGLNPMFMNVDEYARVVAKCGHKEEELRWRVQEFARFKEGIDSTLNTSRFREALNLNHLRKIAETGSCRMPTIYFMSTGINYLDREDIIAIFDGYLRYLKSQPQLEVLLLEDDDLFVENSCWHIKNNRHLMMHSWNIDKPMLVYSDQLMLIDEFQLHFDDIWRAASAETTRRHVMETISELRELCIAKGKEEGTLS